ncbi:MAG: hypothetical protein ACJAS1_004200 [Oleiphilaceae bacterium]|jgi:hypothetical protein
MTKFVLNLTKPEFNTHLEESELWQQAAWGKLFNLLASAVDDANKYRQMRIDEPNEYAAYHNAVYLYGGRGSGKTFFLKNIKRRWQKEGNSRSRLYITDSIDPTLLLNHDSFTNVVVAQIYNEVERYNKKNTVDEGIKQKFYRSLKSLADGMPEGNELDDYVSIDRIIKYRSGVKIENLFHHFIEDACGVLGTTAIAVPIDDVDMALTKAFDVLDVVRRLLSCPLVIPIVSGDAKLYEKITKLHFQKELEKAEDGEQLAEQLNSAYLSKIFPNQFRLRLVGVDEILPDLGIERANGASQNYDEYVKNLISRFYYLCNGQERSTDWPEPTTPREVSQLIHAISLDESKNSLNQWEDFKQWADQKQHGVAYTNAQSVLTNARTNFVEFQLPKLMAFNPLLQAAENFSWASKDFAVEQFEANERIPSRKTGRINSREIANYGLLKAALGISKKILRSMPPIELHTNKMIVPGVTNKSPLITLYTHRDYYTTMANTIAKVFFSRAFELLTVSLIKTQSSLYAEKDWQEYLKQLHNRAPFYCIHAISPTKYMHDEDSKDLEEEDFDYTISNANDDDTLDTMSQLSKKLIIWQKKYAKLLGEFDQDHSLLPLLSSVFNKVFSQLHLFKEQGNVPAEGETLNSIVKRFEYITVNAFATFLIDDYVVVKANTAQSKKVKSISDDKKFKSSDRVFIRNVAKLVDFDSKTALPGKGKIAELIEAVWNHPIFDVYDSDQNDLTLQKTKVKPLFDLKPEVKPLRSAISMKEFTSIDTEELRDSHKLELNRLVDQIISEVGERKRINIAAKANDVFSVEEISVYVDLIEAAIEATSELFAKQSKVMQVRNGLLEALSAKKEK